MVIPHYHIMWSLGNAPNFWCLFCWHTEPRCKHLSPRWCGPPSTSWPRFQYSSSSALCPLNCSPHTWARKNALVLRIALVYTITETGKFKMVVTFLVCEPTGLVILSTLVANKSWNKRLGKKHLPTMPCHSYRFHSLHISIKPLTQWQCCDFLVNYCSNFAKFLSETHHLLLQFNINVQCFRRLLAENAKKWDPWLSI